MKSLRTLSLLFAVSLLATACQVETLLPPEVLEVHEQGFTRIDLTDLGLHISGLPMEVIAEGEAESLAFMREEEKLARDVYRALYYTWERSVFHNISQSEQTHTDAILVLLQRYELPDPAADRGPGEFENTELQALYDELTEQGEADLETALRVGAAIEEIDLLDIQEALNEFIDNQDIAFVYGNLMRGSRNHLRAFVANLETLGVTYEPRYLNPTDFETILSQPVETGSL
ncbi:MAG: DUF2202 domain-containing protein [Bacteroidetes bacterium]|nr:MAG: DUF2202 domain-containing protein [Bacteroidota bacterium]